MAEKGENVKMKEVKLLAERDDASAGDGSVNGDDKHYRKLLDHGIDKNVAAEIIKIYETEKLLPSDLESWALDALKELHSVDAILVLNIFRESTLEYVRKKSAFLCSLINTFREMSEQGGTITSGKGPDKAKLKEILDRTDYSLKVTTGQRIYGGPPPDMDPSPPGAGHEIKCWNIPGDIYEDTLIPLFEKCGKIWELRLMMNPTNGQNRGYCFVTFCEKDGAREAMTQLKKYELRKGKCLMVNVSVKHLRLFVGNIPQSKTKEEILDEISKRTEGLVKVILPGVGDPKLKNRGYANLEYDSPISAYEKKTLGAHLSSVWNCDIVVNWADPELEPGNEVMDKVKRELYVRNLAFDVTEEMLKEKFKMHGKVQRVKKITNHAFVRFEKRAQAIKAMEKLNGMQLGGSNIDVSLAKFPYKIDQDSCSTVYIMNPRGGPPYGEGWHEYCEPPSRHAAPPIPPGRPMRSGGGLLHPPPPMGFGGGKPLYGEFHLDNHYSGDHTTGSKRDPLGNQPIAQQPPIQLSYSQAQWHQTPHGQYWGLPPAIGAGSSQLACTPAAAVGGWRLAIACWASIPAWPTCCHTGETDHTAVAGRTWRPMSEQADARHHVPDAPLCVGL